MPADRQLGEAQPRRSPVQAGDPEPPHRRSRARRVTAAERDVAVTVDIGSTAPSRDGGRHCTRSADVVDGITKASARGGSSGPPSRVVGGPRLGCGGVSARYRTARSSCRRRNGCRPRSAVAPVHRRTGRNTGGYRWNKATQRPHHRRACRSSRGAHAANRFEQLGDAAVKWHPMPRVLGSKPWRHPNTSVSGRSACRTSARQDRVIAQALRRFRRQRARCTSTRSPCRTARARSRV